MQTFPGGEKLRCGGSGATCHQSSPREMEVPFGRRGTSNIYIYTDHKNLEYVRSAKWLKPRQARWALFFSRFIFHITYRPGSKNVKPDALSHMYYDPKEPSVPDTILSAGNFLLLQMDLLSQIKQALAGISCPPGIILVSKEGLLWREDQIFVPENVQVTVLKLLHDHPLADHLGIYKTLDLVRRTFWWPDLKEFCTKYVNSCAVCTWSKTARSRAWGLLKPLPVPDRPCKIISMDFIVELPSFEGCTAIFVDGPLVVISLLPSNQQTSRKN